MNIPYKYPVHWNEVNGSVDEKDGRTYGMIRFADDLAERRKAQEKGEFLMKLMNGDITIWKNPETGLLEVKDNAVDVEERRKPGRPRKVSA